MKIGERQSEVKEGVDRNEWEERNEPENERKRIGGFVRKGENANERKQEQEVKKGERQREATKDQKQRVRRIAWLRKKEGSEDAKKSRLSDVETRPQEQGERGDF